MKKKLFIIGCPRCGTTSLYYYLNDHPDIFMSDVKEPCFYSEDLKTIGRYKVLCDYDDLFLGVKDEKIIGEASTTYIYSDYALNNLPKDAFIIVIYRNPMKMAYSMYNRHHQVGNDICPNFLEAIKKNKEKYSEINYESVVKKCYENLEKYKEKFDNLLVLDFQDFILDTNKTYKKILRFLDVDENHNPKFKIYNKSQRPKSKIINQFSYLVKNSFMKPFFKQLVTTNFRNAVMKGNLEEKRDNSDYFEAEDYLKNIFKNEIKIYEELNVIKPSSSME